MSLPFDTTVPATGHSPSQDYTIQQSNNVSASNIMAVDHYTYSSSHAGEHVQCTFPALINPDPVVSSGSLLYPGPGIAAPTIPQLKYNNSQVLLYPTLVRAYGVINIIYPGGPYPQTISLANSFNVDTVLSQQLSNVTFKIILLPNTIANTNAGVILTASNLIGAASQASIMSYSWASVTELDINITYRPSSGGKITFMVLQA